MSEETSEIAVVEPQEETPRHALVAVNATEMAQAKESIHSFLVAKVRELLGEIHEAQEALEEAQKHKWKTSTFKGIISRLERKRLYYGKLLAACEAGFVIVPNMDVDLFAIRTTRLGYPNMRDLKGSSTFGFNGASPSIPAMEEMRFSVGEGEYRSPEPTVRTQEWKTQEADPKNPAAQITKYHVLHRATGYQEIEFPLAVAHPLVMSAVGEAMKYKIFDRFGVVPRVGRRLRGDPIVLGQITLKEGRNTRVASFLIAWHLDPRTL